MHCDLAARNVLITEDNVLKVSDFGLARKLYDEIYKKSRTSRVCIRVHMVTLCNLLFSCRRVCQLDGWL